MRKINGLFEVMKLFFAWVVLHLFRRELLRQDIWLIREKRTEARDNGYHLFKYLRTEHPEISAFYVITDDSPDMYKIKEYGNIISLNSFQHDLYYLSAKYSIGSQARGAVPSPEDILYRFRKLCRKDQSVIFLQHGVIMSNLSDRLDYHKVPCDLFCCAARRERDYVQQSLHYPDGIVQELGLCRFDNLHKCKSEAKKQILVMPTFRSWLGTSNSGQEASETELEKFKSSDYYQQYISLLRNQRLLEALKNNGYQLVFYPHYAMQPYIRSFQFLSSEQVIIADRKHFDVQQLMIESALMVTDYSSVLFDFAYMEKPEVFFQFDEEQFRSRHYQEGYFDYRRDGFGPVMTKADDIVDYVIKEMNNHCIIEPIYHNRINAFFTLRDDKNCQRTYEAILKINGDLRNDQR